jgi:DNA primase
MQEASMSYVDFEAIKASTSLEEVAKVFGLVLKTEGAQFRSHCPACKSGDHRAIVLTPAKGLFYCFTAKKGGDVIGLAAHCLQVGNKDAAHFLAEQLTPPQEQKSEGRKQPAHAPKRTAETPPPFDPAAFASKLTYSEEVAALGYSEADAAAFGIGFYRGHVYKAARYQSGQTAGYWKHVDGKWMAPKQWLPDVTNNVVHFKRA